MNTALCPSPSMTGALPGAWPGRRLAGRARRRPWLWWLTLAAAAGVSALGGCASPPPPDAQLAVSQAAVVRASGPAATDAATELADARDKLGRARVAYAEKNLPLAHRLAREAEADAVLAETLGRSARADRALTEVRLGLRQLREEMRKP